MSFYFTSFLAGQPTFDFSVNLATLVGLLIAGLGVVYGIKYQTKNNSVRLDKIETNLSGLGELRQKVETLYTWWQRRNNSGGPPR